MTHPSRHAAARIFAHGDLATLAVDTGRGVHVTPQAFAWAAGQLWLVVPTSSLKARSLRRRPRAGALVRHDDHAAMLGGTTELLDTWPLPGALATALWRAPRLGPGVAVYGARNALRTLGITADALTGRMGRIEPRTIVALQPDDVHVVGLVDPPATAPRPGDPPTALSALPPTLADLVLDARHVDLGWPASTGPRAVPATVLDAGAGRFAISRAVLDVAGAPDGEGSAMVHRSPGVRPGDYVGVLLRGPVRLVDDVDEATVEVAIDVDRVTWWEGYRATTVAT